MLDIYNGAEAQRYRDGHRQGLRKAIEPCDTCNLFWPSLDHMPPLRTARFAAEAGYYFLRYRPTGKRAPRRRS